MRTPTRLLAATELALLFPAALFMTALVVRELRPQQLEPARTAQLIVMWYAGRMWTLWLLLVSLPLAALVTGGAALLRSRSRDGELVRTVGQSLGLMRVPLATLLVATTTLTAGGILVLVTLHVLAN
jgi:hypothetical protein